MRTPKVALTIAACTIALAVAGCGRGSTDSPRADGVGGIGTAPADASPGTDGNQAAGSGTGSGSSTGSGSGSGSGTGSGSGNQSGHGTQTQPASPKPSKSTPPGPTIVSFTLKQKPQCPQGTNQFPVPGRPAIVAWKVTGADKVGLSVDQPHVVGSYGTYGLQGEQELYFSCGGPANSIEKHVYTIHTIGGSTQKTASMTVEAKVYEIGQT